MGRVQATASPRRGSGVGLPCRHRAARADLDAAIGAGMGVSTDDRARRLAHRYLIDNTLFVAYMLRQVAGWKFHERDW